MTAYHIGRSGQVLTFSAAAVARFARYRQVSWYHREAGGQLFARISGDRIDVEVTTGPRWLDPPDASYLRASSTLGTAGNRSLSPTWAAFRRRLAHPCRGCSAPISARPREHDRQFQALAPSTERVPDGDRRDQSSAGRHDRNGLRCNGRARTLYGEWNRLNRR